MVDLTNMPKVILNINGQKTQLKLDRNCQIGSKGRFNHSLSTRNPIKDTIE